MTEHTEIADKVAQKIIREQRSNRGSEADRKKPAISPLMQTLLGILLVPTIGIIIVIKLTEAAAADNAEGIEENKATIAKLESETMPREVLQQRFRSIEGWQKDHKEQFDEFKDDTKDSLKQILEEVRK